MKLNERVAIITEENISRLSYLYGEIDIDDLSRIVNSHLKVAIDEIEEDSLKHKAQNCAECDFMKKYEYDKKIYYCNHTDRIDDMGKLGADHLPKTSPVWCPLRNNEK
ncbi:hypothetical protein FMM75_21475 [Lachnospiraceae bacterium MD335]|nr:hypothetical protein [Lachnospiraceae bacterium MD335]